MNGFRKLNVEIGGFVFTYHRRYATYVIKGQLKEVEDNCDEMFNRIHYMIDECMKPFAEEAYRGYSVQLREGTAIHMYFEICNCYADPPEQKDLLRVKYSNNTNHFSDMLYMCIGCKKH